MRTLASILCLSLSFFTLEFAMAADAPHPQLPSGAGAIDADAPVEFTTTPSGLRYRVLRRGDGGMARATNTVQVNYHGWLDGGKVFDSSYQRGEPISFPLNQVIPGWTETTVGVTEMDKLPATARYYLDRIAEVTGVPVHVVSTSPDRDHTILLHNPFGA